MSYVIENRARLPISGSDNARVFPKCQDNFYSLFQYGKSGGLHCGPVTAKPKKLQAFGQLLRRLREERGLTQGQVLLELGKLDIKMSWPALTRYESGDRKQRDPVVLSGLAEIYKADVHGLILVLKANRANPSMDESEVERVLRDHALQRDENTQAATRLAEITSGLSDITADLVALAARSKALAGRQTSASRVTTAGRASRDRRSRRPTDAKGVG
jgi:transcriptional regulator with XRE-family HTH domain